MKGIILAGGKGTRLYPLTAVTNKHLVSIGKLPMIEYPLYTLKKLNPNSISIVTGGEHFQHLAEYFARLHKNIDFSFHYQHKAEGIAQALSYVKQFVKDDKFAVILGDNIFEEDFSAAAKKFESSDLGAMFFLKQVPDPQRFGVAEIKDGKVISIEEKPKQPKSNYAVTGLYFYDSTVFDKIKKLKPSWRGEYELSDVNNMYIQEGKAGFHMIKGFWSDAGTFPSKQKCDEFVKKFLELKVLFSLEKETKDTIINESSFPEEIRKLLS